MTCDRPTEWQHGGAICRGTYWGQERSKRDARTHWFDSGTRREMAAKDRNEGGPKSDRESLVRGLSRAQFLGEDVEVEGVDFEVLDFGGGADHLGLVDEEHVDRLGLEPFGDLGVDRVAGVSVLFLQGLVDLRVGLFGAVGRDVVAAVAGVVAGQVAIRSGDYASFEPDVLAGDYDAFLLSRGYLLDVGDPASDVNSQVGRVHRRGHAADPAAYPDTEPTISAADSLRTA
jgi:hypothetical protein